MVLGTESLASCEAPVQEADLAKGTPVVLRGTVWQRIVAGTAIIELPSGALAAVPVEDLEPGAG
jgi:hypothetical protein